MESQATLVRAKSGVELDAVPAVHLQVTLVVFPDDSELDDTLWDRNDAQRGSVLGMLLEQRALLEGGHKLCLSC